MTRVKNDFAFTFTRSTKLGYTGFARRRDQLHSAKPRLPGGPGPRSALHPVNEVDGRDVAGQ